MSIEETVVAHENNEEKVSVVSILHKDILEIKTVLRELTTAVTRLAVVEERQTQTTTALERAFRIMDSLENRLTTLEKKSTITDRTSRWIERTLLGAAILILYMIAKHIGIYPS